MTRTSVSLKPMLDVSAICSQLQELQRQRAYWLKSRIMIMNRLIAGLAVSDGYNAGMEEKERKKRFDAARERIAKVKTEGPAEDEREPGLILATLPAVDAFDVMAKAFDKEMVKLAKQLPVHDWMEHTDQRGFGWSMLAQTIGETGDLSNYANPGKVWKRLGLAPIESRGKVLMPSTWRKMTTGGLSAEQWTEAGYNPRRRSIAYLIGEGLVKQNGPGPYRKRYDFAKAMGGEKHADWKPLRCHMHGMLLATKLLVKNLWIAWTCGEQRIETEKPDAAVLV